MEPYSLHLAGVLLTFILKVTAGFVLCLVLAYLLPSPRHRFLTWLGFLLGAGLIWMDTLAGEIVSVVSAAWRAAILAGLVTTEGGEHLTVPVSWGWWIARITLLLAATYLAGMFTLLALQTYRHLRLQTWLEQSRQPSPELRQMFARLCREFNIQRCRIAVLPQLKSPATVFWWKPWVVLPEVCESLVGTPQLENVLRHELIHTLRCDYLWAMLGDLLCAVLFFHPAIWQARRRLIMQRELACDLAVVEAQPGHRADYAASLTRFVRLTLQQRPSLSVEFAPPASFLGTRIRCILTEPEEVPGWKRAAADAVFIAFLAIFGSVSPALSVSFTFPAEGSHMQRQLMNPDFRAQQHARADQDGAHWEHPGAYTRRKPQNISGSRESISYPPRHGSAGSESVRNRNNDSPGAAVVSTVRGSYQATHTAIPNHEQGNK